MKILYISLIFLLKLIARLLFFTIAYVIALFTYIITYEIGKRNKVTKRKIKRVKFFLKIKMFLFLKMPNACKFIGIYTYLDSLNKKLIK